MAIKTSTGRMIGLPKTAVDNDGQQVILGGTGISTVQKNMISPPTPTSTKPAPGLVSTPPSPTGSTTPGIKTPGTTSGVTTTPAPTQKPLQKTPVFDANGVNREGVAQVNAGNVQGIGYEQVPFGQQETKPLEVAPPVSNKSRVDVNMDGIMNADELTPEMKAAYNMMTPQEQKAFEDAGKSALNDQTQQTKALANFIQQRREDKDYLTKQNEIQKQQQELKTNVEATQSSQRIAAAQQKLDTLKRNTAYLGTQGQPGVSQQSLELASKQISQAETTFQQLKNIEAQMARYSQLGLEFDANEFENQMDNLQDQLDNNVDKSIQRVFNQLSDPALAESIDTIEGMNALRDKLYSEMDMNIKGYTDVANAQREFLLKQYDQIVKDKQEFIKQENTVNMDMSTAQGYYVNGNGKPILNMDGQAIKVPEKPPYPPQLDLESGKLMTYSIDKNTGKINVDVQQILPPRTNPLDQINLQLKQAELAKMQNELGLTSSSSPIVQSISDPQTQLTIADYSQTQRGRTNLQCGELVNDYITKATGKAPEVRFGNTLTDKLNAVNRLGVSAAPVAGGLFVSNPLGNEVGHTGIVTSVNADGSFNVLEANANGKAAGEPPVTKTYPSTAGFTFSNPPAPTKAPTKDQTKANASLLGKLKSDARVTDYNSLKSSFDKLTSVIAGGVNKKNKASVDQALIMLFNKVLDPNSVVKEGEYARSVEGQAYLDSLRAKYNKFVYGGQGIDDNTRNEMVAVVGSLKDAADQGIQSVKQQYLDTAGDVGATEDFIYNYFKSYENPQQSTTTQSSNQPSNDPLGIRGL